MPVFIFRFKYAATLRGGGTPGDFFLGVICKRKCVSQGSYVLKSLSGSTSARVYGKCVAKE